MRRAKLKHETILILIAVLKHLPQLEQFSIRYIIPGHSFLPIDLRRLPKKTKEKSKEGKIQLCHYFKVMQYYIKVMQNKAIF